MPPKMDSLCGPRSDEGGDSCCSNGFLLHDESLEDFGEPPSVAETTLHYQMAHTWRRCTGGTSVSWDQFLLYATIGAWFLVGLASIITTKMLATSWEVPPLLLTVQQMVLSSSMLLLVLNFSRAVQPWPSTSHQHEEALANPLVDSIAACTSPILEGAKKLDPPSPSLVSSAVKWHWMSFDRDFVLAGLFNALDFLASNSAFHFSAASFVETVKASEPITTTTVALISRIDELRRTEAVALLVLISGVLLATYDNALRTSAEQVSSRAEEESETAFVLSVRTALTVMTANLCFAFRALSQKRYRGNSEVLQLNDTNLLMRMQQMGSCALILPALLAHGGVVSHALLSVSTSVQMQYAGLSLVNAASFAVYNGASCYVLSNVSVLHHSGLNCLRRMFVTIVTCIVFGITLSSVGIAGIALCFTGFVSFTHSRAVRKLRPPSLAFDGQETSVPMASLKVKGTEAQLHTL